MEVERMMLVGDLEELLIIKLSCLTLHKGNMARCTWMRKLNSMKGNEVWTEVDPPPYAKKIPTLEILGSLSLLAIAARTYDYEICQMDVKTAFVNGSLRLKSSFGATWRGRSAFILGIKIYRDRSPRLIGLNQSAYIDKILKKFSMQNSKKGFIPMEVKHVRSNENVHKARCGSLLKNLVSQVDFYRFGKLQLGFCDAYMGNAIIKRIRYSLSGRLCLCRQMARSRVGLLQGKPFGLGTSLLEILE
ncbi:hypothetical protein Tco_1093021 [Tanacetum coccineum]|uniref:Reverse transcriptase Ty1/copia-type domain-containing protein n=1 Tax=Tanacetum coccineum TaxID=301880 RepID=A0ABQ5IBH5_9ASTR